MAVSGLIKPSMWGPVGPGLVAPEWRDLWRGLKMGVPWDDYRDVVSGAPAILDGTTLVATEIGLARDFDGATDRIDWANIQDWATQAQTISFLIYPDSVATLQYFMADHASGDASLGGVTVWSSGSAEGIIEFIGRFDTNVSRASATATLVIGSWQHILITWDGSTTGANIHIYLNGSEVSYSSTTNGSGAPVAAGGSHSIGGRITSDTRNSDGKIAAPSRWDRILSKGEIVKLAQDPFGPFRMEDIAPWATVAPPAAAISPQMQFSNLGADLYDGALIQ